MFTKINGCHIDMRTVSFQQYPFNGSGKDFALEDCVIIGQPGIRWIYNEQGNGYQTALYPHNLIEGITVHAGSAVFGSLASTESVYRDITISPVLTGSTGSSEHHLALDARWRDHPAWETPQVNVFDNIDSQQTAYYFASVKINANAVGSTYFILNSSFDNTSRTLFRGLGGGGVGDYDSGGDASKLMVYFRDTDLHISDASGGFQYMSLFLTSGRFERLTDSGSGAGARRAGTWRSRQRAGRRSWTWTRRCGGCRQTRAT